MPKLDPEKMPAALLPLLPMAERWGVGDDGDRERMVHEASDDDLTQLIHCIDGITDQELFGWLAGPESYNPKPSDEYVAITCLTMARDSARTVLARRRTRHHETGNA
jgi:hypothetical protein